MAGGTGGHIFPALAVAYGLKEQGYEIHWLGTHQGLEKEIVNSHNIPLHYINISGIRGKNMLTLLKAPFKMIIALYQSMRVIIKLKPKLVLGFGGFVTGPGGIASKLLGVPLIIHEQNAVLGTTNFFLSYFATRLCQGFPNTFKKQFLYKTYTTGNPVREEFSTIKPLESNKLLDTYQPLRLLILGGSRGAHFLNENMPKVFNLLTDIPLQITHQTGKLSFHNCLKAYQDLSVRAEVVPFIENIAEAYQNADLVIARSGALTVAELTLAGRAAILIPFPYAIDDHQTANANWLKTHQAAIIFQQKELTEEGMADSIRYLEKNRTEILKMGQNAKNQAMLNASSTIVKISIEVLNEFIK
ncbi:MAG: murG [Francisellaceae bacterium]|nr:murG [Francisellaceae bacterium]